ncbi:MAG: TauD/TfdA family dioxygenase [Myxococcales bacterium]|nr:TauD/TfdA family dioxygenase [Myxococcales bacterium]MDD9968440.1 TauD/TfdA family dioxygenase [Myxococcales bacterium]
MNQPYRYIEVHPQNGALGCELFGVNLAEPVRDEVMEEIHRAWLDHQVLFFRDQNITPAQQVDFARHFGELDTYPFIEPLPDQPEVVPIIKEPDNRFNFGGGWHSDTSYMPKPPKATMLRALEVPRRGGDTLFANQYAAYEALSPGMKDMLAGRRAVFTASQVHGSSGYYRKADHPMDMKKPQDAVERRVDHPIVRTHPETGRRALYVSVPHVERFRQMSREESRPVLEYLCGHAVKPEFTFRFHWRPHSIALWDNRCVQHYALNDYAGQRRVMHRITIKGDMPR